MKLGISNAIDTLEQNALIWKKEWFSDGASASP